MGDQASILIDLDGKGMISRKNDGNDRMIISRDGGRESDIIYDPAYAYPLEAGAGANRIDTLDSETHREASALLNQKRRLGL